MPLLSSANETCESLELPPCKPPDLCPLCLARQYLTPMDWRVLDFYALVSDQYVNQTPMGTESGKPVTTLRMEAIEAAMRIFEVPQAERSWLARAVITLHRATVDPPSLRELRAPLEEFAWRS